MRKDSIVFGVAGVFFGILVGWIVGSQQATVVAPPPAAAATPASGTPSAQAPPAFDEARAAALKTTADQNPTESVTLRRAVLHNA